MKKTTATITWLKYHNYGTLLQAYALQQYILSLGYKNVILDDSARREPHETQFVLLKEQFKRLVSNIIFTKDRSSRTFLKGKKMRKILFEKFIKCHLNISKETNHDDLLNKKYGLFICGSDQIWNPNNCKQLNPYYYAGFSSQKKIAYAPSMGVIEYPEHLKDELIRYTSSFSALSMREANACEFLSSLLGKPVDRVVDPTLLLTEQEWKKMIDPPKEKKKKYILAYFLTPNKWYLDYVKQYAIQQGVILKMFFIHPSYCNIADETVTAGPIEFLEEIHNASFLFTDSFHGTIFASLFEIPFITFKRFNESSFMNQNSRVKNLFSMMDIPERFIGKGDYEKINELPPIDFKEIKNNLNPYIIHSKTYLEKALFSNLDTPSFNK